MSVKNYPPIKLQKKFLIFIIGIKTSRNYWKLILDGSKGRLESVMCLMAWGSIPLASVRVPRFYK